MAGPAVCVLVLGLIAGLLYACVWSIYTIWFHPLSSIPNASALSPISRLLWTLPSEYKGRITLDLPRLHDKHGPLVRIGPNELSFYSLEIYKTVYSVRSPFVKDPRVYGQFVQDSHPALFSITDENEHSQRRRLMGQLFNLSKMDALEGMMMGHIGYFIQAIQQKTTRSIEVMCACRSLEADIVSSFGFGQEIGAIRSWVTGEPLGMVKANDEKSTIIALSSTFPTMFAIFGRLESHLHHLTGWQTRSSAAIDAFDLWSSNQLTRLLSDTKSLSSHPNFIHTMIRSRLPASCALSEAKEMLGPGTDTTSATLAHILWALAHDYQYQQTLFQDLEKAQWPTGIGSLELIPRLRAAVREGIRWTGAAAAMLPRVVPEGGATLAGSFVPGGTVISSSPIWYLHDKVAFKSPKIYRPSRWLDDHEKGSEETKLRDEFYIPFSKGSANCIGAHFAIYELLLSLSQMLKAFKLVLPVDVSSFSHSTEAYLPKRLEWVAAVPSVDLEVCFISRKQ